VSTTRTGEWLRKQGDSCEWTAYSELSNIGSLPNSIVGVRVSEEFIFAFVCTAGTSSNRGLVDGNAWGNVSESLESGEPDEHYSAMRTR
jgi:outer membrane protease